MSASVGSVAAAARLGVSVRQVQRMVAAGSLAGERTVGGALLVDAVSLNAAQLSRPGRGRPWGPDMAWAGLWTLSSRTSPIGLGARDLSRLDALLRRVTADQLVVATRRRAEVRRYRGSSSFSGEAAATLALTAASALTAPPFRLVGRTDGGMDGYCSSAALGSLVRRAHLVEDRSGLIVVRVPNTPAVLEAMSADGVPPAVVAADLAASGDARERTEGLRVLRGLLRRHCARKA